MCTDPQSHNTAVSSESVRRSSMSSPSVHGAILRMVLVRIIAELENNSLSDEGWENLLFLQYMLGALARQSTVMATMRRMDAQTLRSRLEDGAEALGDLASLSRRR